MSILIRFENNVTQCVSDQFNVHFLPCACCCWVVGERGVSPPASCAPLVTSRCSAAAGAVVNKPSSHHCPAPVSWPVYVPWNNGKEVPRLDLTSLTMPGQQIHYGRPCDWLQYRLAALPLISCPHSLVYLHLPVVKGLNFCISANPPSGNLLPIITCFIVSTCKYDACLPNLHPPIS